MSGRKGPRSKPAAELLSQFQRPIGTRSLEQRHLIVCEDDKSSPAYFKALIRHLGIHASSVSVVGSKGKSSPAQVVGNAITRKEAAASEESATEPFDRVWCVIDGDYGNLIQPARATARRHDIEVIVSTPCFEYWLLLHLEDSAKLTPKCSDAEAMLKKHIPRYQKGSFNFGSIVDRASIAGVRAEKHRRGTGTSTLPENQNPCSEIHRLIEELKRKV